jgi:hypothetical protein
MTDNFTWTLIYMPERRLSEGYRWSFTDYCDLLYILCDVDGANAEAKSLP